MMLIVSCGTLHNITKGNPSDMGFPSRRWYETAGMWNKRMASQESTFSKKIHSYTSADSSGLSKKEKEKIIEEFPLKHEQYMREQAEKKLAEEESKRIQSDSLSEKYYGENQKLEASLAAQKRKTEELEKQLAEERLKKEKLKTQNKFTTKVAHPNTKKVRPVTATNSASVRKICQKLRDNNRYTRSQVHANDWEMSDRQFEKHVQTYAYKLGELMAVCFSEVGVPEEFINLKATPRYRDPGYGYAIRIYVPVAIGLRGPGALDHVLDIDPVSGKYYYNGTM